MGWIGSQILSDENKDEAEYLRKLCKERHASRDALQYGELLAPVVIKNGGTVSWVNESGDRKEEIHRPAVLASAWLTPEGKHKLVLTNVADESRTVTMGLDQRHTGPCDGKVLRLRQVGGEATVDLGRKGSGVFEGSVELEPLSAMVLEVEGDVTDH
jgi:hypothetical protein